LYLFQSFLFLSLPSIIPFCLLHFINFPNPSGRTSPRVYTASNRNEYQREGKKCFRGVDRGRRERLTTSPPSVSRFSTQYLDPQHLIGLYTSTGCYGDSFISRRWLWRMGSSGMLRRVVVRTDVSEELSASFIRVTRIGELGTMPVRASVFFLFHRFLSPWWIRRYVPLKCRLLQEPHGVTSQKTPFFKNQIITQSHFSGVKIRSVDYDISSSQTRFSIARSDRALANLHAVRIRPLIMRLSSQLKI
jgi:hypothetical protein